MPARSIWAERALSDLGAQAVGTRINGRHMPLRTPLNNGDVVEIIKSRRSAPQLSWLGFVVTGKARAAIRRAGRAKERAEIAAIGRKLFDEIAPKYADRTSGFTRIVKIGQARPEELLCLFEGVNPTSDQNPGDRRRYID